MRFVHSRQELRSLYKTPPPDDIAVRKELTRLDAHCRAFIAHSPIVFIGSTADSADVSPRGDRAGFVEVLDDTTLAIPDRPGNNRLDTLENILRNPAVGLLFLVPGMNETLRVNGDAQITIDPHLREILSVNGRAPTSVIVVSVKAAYMHCAKAFIRSDLWNPQTWPERSSLPTLGQILRDQRAVNESAHQTDELLAVAYAKTLW